MVDEKGFEPLRHFWHENLNLACLPIPSLIHIKRAEGFKPSCLSTSAFYSDAYLFRHAHIWIPIFLLPLIVSRISKKKFHITDTAYQIVESITSCFCFVCSRSREDLDTGPSPYHIE